MSDYVVESNAKLKEFLEARKATIEELKAILNDANQTRSVANTAKVTGSWVLELALQSSTLDMVYPTLIMKLVIQ